VRHQFYGPLRHSAESLESNTEIRENSRKKTDIWIDAILREPLRPFAHVKVFVHYAFLQVTFAACLDLVARAGDEAVGTEAVERLNLKLVKK
jgi:hypothetical protein